MKKIVIIGAGFSGLSLAYFLCQNKEYKIEIYEKKDRVGGLISSPSTAFGIYETAANGFLNTPEVEEFLNSIQVKAIGSSQKANRKYIFNKTPKRWPLQILPTIYFICLFVVFLFKKNKKPLEFESVEEWSLKHFGKLFTDYLLSPALQGIYAGNIAKLSATLILKRFFNSKPQKNQKKKLIKSNTVSASDGMGSVILKLKNYLIQNDVAIYENQSWSPESQADQIVIATSLNEALPILKQINTVESLKNYDVLSEVETLSLVSVTCFFKAPPQNHTGFGILFPSNEKFNVMGLLMNGIIFNRDHDYHSETWIFGGANNPYFFKKTDEEIKAIIQQERVKIFAQQQDILEFKVTRWPNALPHYTVTLEKKLSEIVEMPNVSLHGNYLGQIGLSRILERSQALAAEISQKV